MSRRLLHQLICDNCGQTIEDDVRAPILPEEWAEDWSGREPIHRCDRCERQIDALSYALEPMILRILKEHPEILKREEERWRPPEPYTLLPKVWPTTEEPAPEA